MKIIKKTIIIIEIIILLIMSLLNTVSISKASIGLMAIFRLILSILA